MARTASALHTLICAIRFATLEVKLGVLVAALERRYRPDQPRAPRGTSEGGQWIDDLSRLLPAGQSPDRIRVAGPRCDGFSSGCQLGGTFGTTGMYQISGKKFCRDCAIKFLGIQELPHEEQMNTLRGFDPTVFK